MDVAGDKPELVVIGGAEVFAMALPLASRIYLTRIHGRFNGDTYFPAFDRREWRAVSECEHAADERHAYALTFMTLERRGCA
jgi:dihydrofolate reductase